MYIYMHIHIYTYICIYVYMYIYIHTYIHTFMYIDLHHWQHDGDEEDREVLYQRLAAALQQSGSNLHPLTNLVPNLPHNCCTATERLQPAPSLWQSISSPPTPRSSRQRIAPKWCESQTTKDRRRTRGRPAAYASIRKHTSAYVSIRQHASA